MMINVFIMILALLCVLYLFLIAPDSASQRKRKKIQCKFYAHRGLYTKDGTVPENSMPAFADAVRAGYGIELDVRLSADGEVIVFHDATLERMCGVKKRVIDCPFSMLSRLFLRGTKEKIPLFSQVLESVSGQVPLIVELKSEGIRNRELCRKTMELLRNYEGAFCVESFDPRILSWFYHHEPRVYRGQLTAPYKRLKSETNRLFAFAVSRVLTNCFTRPDFLAHSIGRKSFSVRFCEWLGAAQFVWTVRPEDSRRENLNGNDGIIFEFYHPAC